MKIPKLALGTGGIMKGHNDIIEMLKALKDSGINHIDTAQGYKNELQVGKDIQSLDWTDSFVTTKVHPINMKYHTRESVLESIEALGHVDLVLLHGPVNKEVNIIAFKELIKLREEGLIKGVGVSNFEINQIDELHQATGEYPLNNQIRVTPTYLDEILIEECQARGIIVSAYSPLGSYYRSDNELYMSETERKYIDSLAAKYNRSVSNIIFRWLLDKNINVVFQSRKPERVKENINVEGFHLTSDEISFINNFDKGKRYIEMGIPTEEQMLKGVFINR